MRKSKGFARGKQTWLVAKQMTTRLIRMQKLMIGTETVKEPQNPNWEVVVLPHPATQPQPPGLLVLAPRILGVGGAARAHTYTQCTAGKGFCRCSLVYGGGGGRKRASWQPFNLSPVKATFESHHTGSWDNRSKLGTCLPRLRAYKIPGSTVGDPGKDRYPPPGRTGAQQAPNEGKLWDGE